MNISEFINKYYDIKYKSANVKDDLSNVDEFLLSERHGSVGHDIINSLFINSFAASEDVVLVEGKESMKQIEKDKALQAVSLTTQAKIMGWDIADVEQMSILSSNLDQQSLAKATRIFKVLLKNFLDSNFNGDKEDVRLKLIRTSKSIHCLILASGITSDNEAAKSAYEKIAESFSLRTQAMQDSLTNVKTLASRTFLIAGENHLETIPECLEDSRFSLSEFYTFLNNRKTVILFPKLEKIWEVGQEQEKLIKEIHEEAYLQLLVESALI